MQLKKDQKRLLMHVEKAVTLIYCVYDVSEYSKLYYVNKNLQAALEKLHPSILSGPSRGIDLSLLCRNHLFHSTLATVRTYLDESVF